MKYPFIDPEDESKDDILKELRLKFKSICATLGLTLVCKGYPKMSDADDYWLLGITNKWGTVSNLLCFSYKIR